MRTSLQTVGVSVLLALALPHVGGCFSPVVDDLAFVDCGGNDDCPPEQRCEPGLGRGGRGRCLSVDRTLPVALAVEVETPEDTPVDVTLAGRDADGDALQFVVVAADESAGTVSGVDDGVVSFAPRADWFGTATLSFVARDDDGLASAPAIATIRVLPVDDPPRFVAPVALSTDEETRLQVNVDLFATDDAGRDSDTLQVIDVDDVGLSVSVAASSAAATLVQEADGDFAYTPPRDFSGRDTLVVTATVGARSVTHTLAIDVVAVNDAPTIAIEPVVTEEDLAVDTPITVADVDHDVGQLVVEVLASDNDALGVLTIEDGPVLRFVPTPDLSGNALVTLSVRDGDGAAGTVNVRLVVVPVADVPVATAVALSVVEDTPTSFALAGTSVDDSPLTYVIARPPSQGAIVDFDAATGLGSYVPQADATGVDQFSFVVSDGAGLTSAPVDVTVTIDAVDDPPTIASTEFVLAEDAAADTYRLVIVDPEGDPVTLTVIDDGALGTASVVDADTLSYVPSPDANGVDEVVVVADSSRPSAPVTIRFVVLPVADTPRALPDTIEGDEDSALAVVLRGVDPDGDRPLEFAVVTPPAHGRLTFSAGSDRIAVYEPDDDYFGADSFLFLARADGAAGVPATVSVNVRPVNDAPTLQWQGERTDVSIARPRAAPPLLAADVDGDGIVLSVEGDPAVGRAEIDGNTVKLLLSNTDGRFVGDVDVTVVAEDLSGARSQRVAVPFRVIIDSTCASLRNSGITQNGVYDIGATRGFCDMTTDGGGWTLVAKIVDEWSFDDPRWEIDRVLDVDPLATAFPDSDARLPTWDQLPPASSVLIETWDATTPPSGRRTVTLDLTTPQDLSKLFIAKTAIGTNVPFTDWAEAFTPGRAPPGGIVCVQDGANIVLASTDRCRLCAFGSNGSVRPGVCSGTTEQVYGIGVDGLLSVNAGAAGSTNTRRRAALWVRDDDFSKEFPSARTCADHSAAGRVLSGRYDVNGQTQFCALGG
jgi:hypothetical protein